MNGHFLPIFYDPSKKRWKTFLTSISIVFGLLLIIAYIFTRDFFTTDFVSLSPAIATTQNTLSTQQSIDFTKFNQLKNDVNNITLFQEASNASDFKVHENHRYQRMAFYNSWDSDSFKSLEKNILDIDILITEWLQVKNQHGEIIFLDQPDEQKLKTFVSQTKPELKIIPQISNFNINNRTWDSNTIQDIISDNVTRYEFIKTLHNYILQNGYSGITLNFVDITTSKEYLNFLSELTNTFKTHKLKTYLMLPLNNSSIDYIASADVVDKIILTAYDENWATSNPGAVASHLWYSNNIALRLNEIPHEKLFISIGNFGYDWKEGAEYAELITFQDVMNLIKKHNVQLQFDQMRLNPYFEYTDKYGKTHKVWYLDSITAYNQILMASKFNPNGFALWRLGSEDMRVWEIFKNPYSINLKKIEALETITLEDTMINDGNGEILKITTLPIEGKRELSFDASSGLIFDQKITQYPSAYSVERYGDVPDSMLSLTFDDGPDPKYTPQILDILKTKNIKATFFIVGNRAEYNPELIRRIYEEGHEIGNHTFTHPNLTKVNNLQIYLEVKSTQKLLSSILGKTTLLFRPPYGIDSNPQTIEEIKSLELINRMGMYTVGMELDPKDWDTEDPGEIALNLYDQLNSSSGNIILLHDAGGNREATIKALPQIIDFMQSNNYKIVPISELMGMTRDEIMPSVEASFLNLDYTVFSGWRLLGSALNSLLFIGIGYATIRLSAMLVLALMQKAKNTKLKKSGHKSYKPLVAVLVPAYNEGTIINSTIESILASTYKRIEIIVVDDGSTDDTHSILKTSYQNHKQVKIYSKPQGGKSNALNYAIGKTRATLVAVIDADTILKPDAIGQMVTQFKNVQIGAVAGNVKVGNRNTLISKLQAIEYITSQNLERRFLDYINCITVVPGAIGMWRKKLILQAGGFSSQTLAEDAELTLSILKMHYKVVYEEKAIGYTEAPVKLNSFMKQRFRWMFGIVQTVFKHLDLVFNYKYGFLGLYALPFNVIVQLVFSILAPLLDVYVVLSLAYSFIQAYFHPELNNIGFNHIIYLYIALLFIDILTSFISLTLEGKENYKLLIYLPLQRVIFRILYYIIATRVLLNMIKGPKVDWNKLVRTGDVNIHKL